MVAESPPRPDWAQQRQPDPPNFGQAKRVSRARLALAVLRRRRRARRIVASSARYCSYEPGLVTLVVLSCRRLPELKRLCETLVPFFTDIETSVRVERLLVDNGSGEELLAYARSLGFFDEILAHPENLGMMDALADAYGRCRGEYVLLVEDDFYLDYGQPFLSRLLKLLAEYPEIGIVRLKDQNNWWKPYRRIGPLRATKDGTMFWTWLPSRGRWFNVWAAGSVLFRRVSVFSEGPLPRQADFPERAGTMVYEEVFGRRYNRHWLAAKVKDVTPFVQPNDNLPV